MKRYGRYIKYQRTIRGIKMETLAKKLNITQACISLWENDKRIPSIENIEKLADIYEITIEELIGRE